MPRKYLFINASAKKDGSTVECGTALLEGLESEQIHLVDYRIGFFGQSFDDDEFDAVLEKMLAGGFTLGGEQSGHVIDTLHATTGDGVLTSLRVAARLKRTGRTLTELAGIVTRLPQTLINVTGVDKGAAGTNAAVQRAVADAEDGLGETGRVLLRPSGTEPLVRVMVEAATQTEADRVAGELAGVVEDNLGL